MTKLIGILVIGFSIINAYKVGSTIFLSGLPVPGQLIELLAYIVLLVVGVVILTMDK